jgi:hypothetical protein
MPNVDTCCATKGPVSSAGMRLVVSKSSRSKVNGIKRLVERQVEVFKFVGTEGLEA